MCLFGVCLVALQVCAAWAYTASCHVQGCDTNRHFFINTTLRGEMELAWKTNAFATSYSFACTTTSTQAACSTIDTKDEPPTPIDEKPGLVVFDPEGNIRWKSCKTHVPFPPVYYEVGLFAIDASNVTDFSLNGSLRHSQYTMDSTPYTTGFTITADSVLILTANHGLVALDQYGNLLMSQKLQESGFYPYDTPVIGDDGTIYVAAGTNVYVENEHKTPTARRLYAFRFTLRDEGKASARLDELWYYPFSSNASAHETKLTYYDSMVFVQYAESYSPPYMTISAIGDKGNWASLIWSVNFYDRIVSIGVYPNVTDPFGGLVVALASGQFLFLNPYSGEVKYEVNLDVVIGYRITIQSFVMIAPPSNDSFATPTLFFGAEIESPKESRTQIGVAMFGMNRDHQPIWQMVSPGDGNVIYGQLAPFDPDETGQASQLVGMTDSTIFSVRIG